MPQVSLSEWIDGIQHGHLASFPTDTVPALAARPEAGDRIFSFKRRPPEKPLILMAANWSDLLPYVVGSSAEQASWQQLTQAHWPGQLTLVLPASDRLPLAINPNQTGTVGIRIPNHPVALALLNATGALATTSVNRSGQPALIAQADIEAQFPELLTLAPAAQAKLGQSAESGGASGTSFEISSGISSGVPSTVVKWHRETGWQVLRQGAVTIEPD